MPGGVSRAGRSLAGRARRAESPPGAVGGVAPVPGGVSRAGRSQAYRAGRAGRSLAGRAWRAESPDRRTSGSSASSAAAIAIRALATDLDAGIVQGTAQPDLRLANPDAHLAHVEVGQEFVADRLGDRFQEAE